MKKIIFLLLIIILAVSVASRFLFFKKPLKNALPVVCTTEAKLCPDGTAVGRSGLINCEFDPCPAKVK